MEEFLRKAETHSNDLRALHGMIETLQFEQYYKANVAEAESLILKIRFGETSGDRKTNLSILRHRYKCFHKIEKSLFELRREAVVLHIAGYSKMDKETLAVEIEAKRSVLNYGKDQGNFSTDNGLQGSLAQVGSLTSGDSVQGLEIEEVHTATS